MKEKEILLKIDELKFLYNKENNNRNNTHIHYLQFFVLIITRFCLLLQFLLVRTYPSYSYL